MELIIGPRTFSTWSLRPWLVLKRCGAEFTVRELDFNTAEGHAEMLAVSPSGLVPVLRVEGETLWDTLAISLWCEERYPEAPLWPRNAHARWQARSVVAEMHSGFSALRTACSMNKDHWMVSDDRAPAPEDPRVEADVRRLVTMWRQMRNRFGADGDYLFGDWSIADAFFTPVATRIRHYQIDLAAHGDDAGTATAYVATLLAQPDYLDWEAEARRG